MRNALDIFTFLDYKDYIRKFEEYKSENQKGFRSRLAEALNCQNAYISKILNSDVHFSLEQGIKLCGFLNLDKNETHYLMLLIEFERAGSEELKKYFLQEILDVKEKFFSVSSRVGYTQKTLTTEQQVKYYSQWHYLALHMIVSIPKYRTADSMSKALCLDIDDVISSLEFLRSIGYVEEFKPGYFKMGPSQTHLSKSSPLFRSQHALMRQAATTHFHHERGVFYSSLASMSKVDAEKLKSRMLKLIEDYVQTVGPSKEEVLFAFNLDFYPLIKD